MQLQPDRKCIVLNCENRTTEGRFVGDLCSPCHNFITTGIGKHSQAYRNSKDVVINAMIAERDGLDRAISYLLYNINKV